MTNGLSEIHLVISEKNPFLMANFMYSFLELFQNVTKINHLPKLQILTMENVMMSVNLSQAEHGRVYK